MNKKINHIYNIGIKRKKREKMAFSYDRAEYHEICNKIYQRAVRFVDNNLPEAIESNDVQLLFEIYIKVYRARAQMAEDDSSTEDYKYIVSLVAMLKHFLNMNECYEHLKVAYDFNRKEMVYLDEGEKRPYDLVGDEEDSEDDSTYEDYNTDIDEKSAEEFDEDEEDDEDDA